MKKPLSWRFFILFYGWPSFLPNKHCWLRASRNQWLLPCHNDKSQPSIGRFLIRCLLFFKTLLLVLLHKVWCDAFDNFFQTEGNGQDSAEFIDFWKQKENKCYSFSITRLFLLFMINLLVKQPQRGSNMKWGISKTIFWIFISKWKIVIYPTSFSS